MIADEFMGTQYLNINKDLAIIESDDKVFSKKDLINKFEEFISNGGYKLKQWIKCSNAPYECLILNRSNEIFDLIIYLKNITGAGRKDKINRKRVQVSNIKKVSPDDFIPTSINRTMIILGYYNFDNNPIMVAWDAYRYIGHNTMRSAYVTVETLLRGYQNGYIETIDSSQKVWVFNSANFEKFLNEYINYNK